MTLDEFMLMETEQQYLYWRDHAVAVSTAELSFAAKVLYQLDSFYVEATFLKITPGEAYLIAFEDTSLLSRYIREIDISSVIEEIT